MSNKAKTSNNVSLSLSGSLSVPQTSGMVTLPLAEVDAMRMQHANAIRIAQELESQQKLVKIEVTEVTQMERFRTESIYAKDSSRNGWSKPMSPWEQEMHMQGIKSPVQERQVFDGYTTSKAVINVQMVNMEEIAEDLTLTANIEANARVEAKVKGLEDNLKRLHGELVDTEAKLESKKEANRRLQSERDKSQEEVRVLTETNEAQALVIETMKMQEDNLFRPTLDAYNKLKGQRTLWGWFYDKFLTDKEEVE